MFSKFCRLFVLTLGALPLYSAPAATQTSLTVAPDSQLHFGDVVTLTATVTDGSLNPVLFGSVTFLDDTNPLGTVQLVGRAGGAGAPGTATLKTTRLKISRHSLSARFNLLPGYEGSQSSDF